MGLTAGHRSSRAPSPPEDKGLAACRRHKSHTNILLRQQGKAVLSRDDELSPVALADWFGGGQVQGGKISESAMPTEAEVEMRSGG